MLKLIGSGSYKSVYIDSSNSDISNISIESYISNLSNVSSSQFSNNVTILASHCFSNINEIAILKSLHHSNICKVKDVLFTDNHILYYQDYYGENCYTQNLIENQIIIILLQMLDVLCYLKSMKVIHRDISPSNILFRESKAVLIDFGLSIKVLDPNMSLDNNVYVSILRPPEVNNDMKYNYSADIYALAASIVCMKKGWIETDTVCMKNKNVTRDIACMSLRYPDNNVEEQLVKIHGFKSDILIKVLSKMLEYNPESRISAETALSMLGYKYIEYPIYTLQKYTIICNKFIRAISKYRECIDSSIIMLCYHIYIKVINSNKSSNLKTTLKSLIGCIALSTQGDKYINDILKISGMTYDEVYSSAVIIYSKIQCSIYL